MIFDPTFKNVESAMRASSAKQAVHAHNLANANTPDFEPLDFDDELNQAVKRQGEKRVIVEEEMSELAKNSVKYSAYVKLLSTKFGILRNIVSQGRK